MTSKKALIIDNTFPHSTSHQLLAEEGFKVDLVHNSDAGLQHLESQPYDIIIIHESYEAESWHLCERIRRLCHMPLIVISAGASADTCVKAINAGADYFLRKSFGPLEFLGRVQCLLQRTSINQPAPVGS